MSTQKQPPLRYTDPDTITVAYHQEQGTVIEFWDEDETLVAFLPSGEYIQGKSAMEALNAVVQDEDTLVRKVDV